MKNFSAIMKDIIKCLVIAYYRIFLAWRKPLKYVFIISHMRSGSSVLAHVLFTNPEIFGFGETHIRYSKKKDFIKLSAKVLFKLRHLRIPEEANYILDKILHNVEMAKPEIFAQEDVFIIFLIREPNSSITSTMRLLGWDEERALSYYLCRLHTMETMARMLKGNGRTVVVKYEDLLNRTEEVLVFLAKFLYLKKPLRETYEVLRFTGDRVIGDSSHNIRLGRITRVTHSESKPRLSSLSQKMAKKAYLECCNTIQKYVRTIDDDIRIER